MPHIMDQSQVDKLTQIEFEGGADKTINFFLCMNWATIIVAPNSLIESIVIVNI